MKRMKLLYFVMLIAASFGMHACSDDDTPEQSSWYGTQTTQTLNNDTGEWEDQLLCIELVFTQGEARCKVMRSLAGMLSATVDTYPCAWKTEGKSFVLYDNSIMDDNTIWEGTIEGKSMTLTHHQSKTTYNLTKK